MNSPDRRDLALHLIRSEFKNGSYTPSVEGHEIPPPGVPIPWTTDHFGLAIALNLFTNLLPPGVEGKDPVEVATQAVEQARVYGIGMLNRSASLMIDVDRAQYPQNHKRPHLYVVDMPNLTYNEFYEVVHAVCELVRALVKAQPRLRPE